MKINTLATLAIATVGLMALSACSKPDAPVVADPPVAQRAPTAPATTQYPENVYWGDTHVHSGWSADAGLDGAILSPEDAFR